MILIGHRGARGEAPENTLGGFRHMLNVGIRAVEFDVRMLRNGDLVVIHDDNLLRTANLDLPLLALNTSDLSQVDQRKGWPNWPHAEPLPLLKDVLAMLSNVDHIELEVKGVEDLYQAHVLVGRLLNQIRGFRDRVTVTSFDLNVLRALQLSRAPIKRGLLIETRLPDDVLGLAQSLGCEHLGLQDSLCTHTLVEQIQDEDCWCSVWTVNDVDRALQLEYWGVDGLITDIPSTMISQNVGQFTRR
jgi:glycerophosphoryl diester phosphodiesterase